MPRVCTACTSPNREAIDRALVAATPLRTIADQHGVSKTALIRHKADHLPAALVKGKEAKEEAHALDIVKQLKTINAVTFEILAAARKGRDSETALKAIDRVQRQIEMQAKLLGALNDGTVVNILVAPEWLQLRATILVALAPHPEARQSVAAALARAEGHARN
jgi:hypothetical protein